MKTRRSKRAKSPHHTILEVFLQNYPTNSRFAEAYRTLRTNLHFSFMEKDYHTILVTSAAQAEGKTSTVANLAYIISHAGRTVLMIDADLRKPRLDRLTPSQDSVGLTGLLSDLFSTDLRNGLLDHFGVSDLFRLASLQKKTGLLQLSDGKDEVDLLFFQGELVDVNWKTRPEEKRLATALIKNNLASKEQLRQAIVRQKDTGQKLGFILIHMGVMKKEDLIGPLTIQMMESLRTAIQFKRGSFSFKELSESDFDRASFDPVDFNRLYRQVIIGEEELPYLQEKIGSAVLKTTAPNLFLLPSGHLPPNPSELLSSNRMSFLITYLKKRFDVLVIDTPPILPASDALLLVPHSDGVLLMVKAGLMNREIVKRAVERLELAQANLLGVVLNQVDIRREGYYKYYHKYYPKYYGGSA